MNARTLSQHYAQLTGEERLRLMLAAQARGDHAEIVSLWTSCPQMEIIVPDPNFSRLILGVLVEVGSVILQWVQFSHYVVRDRLLAAALEADDDIALARKIEAEWRRWSAVWKGVESAITRFCAQTELTPEQLLMPEPPHLIEEARDHLHPKSRVSRAIETGVLRRLRQAWVGAPPSLENDDLH
jgi:hypothetical protein